MKNNIPFNVESGSKICLNLKHFWIQNLLRHCLVYNLSTFFVVIKLLLWRIDWSLLVTTMLNTKFMDYLCMKWALIHSDVTLTAASLVHLTDIVSILLQWTCQSEFFRTWKTNPFLMQTNQPKILLISKNWMICVVWKSPLHSKNGWLFFLGMK